MNTLLSFAIYLETSGPGESARRIRRRFPSALVEVARDRWSGRLLRPKTTSGIVEAALGPPAARDEFMMGYALPMRPGYMYTFDFDSPTRLLRASGFRRSEAIHFPFHDVSNPTQLRQKLGEIGATTNEVRSWLGVAAGEYGWWPVETWEYSNGLILEFRHGVVEEMN
jgi:hypothetical protein